MIVLLTLIVSLQTLYIPPLYIYYTILYSIRILTISIWYTNVYIFYIPYMVYGKKKKKRKKKRKKKNCSVWLCLCSLNLALFKIMNARSARREERATYYKHEALW